MKAVISRILSGFLALVYLATAALKFVAAPMEVAQFSLFGYPLWFMFVVATLELVCAVGLLVPRFATVAALLLVCDMLGAAASHLMHGQAKMAVVPVALLLILIVFISLRGGFKASAGLPGRRSLGEPNA